MDAEILPCDAPKRRRKPIQMKKKIEIIRFAMENPEMTHSQIGERFGVPRTTIIGILKNKERLVQLEPTLLPESYIARNP